MTTCACVRACVRACRVEVTAAPWHSEEDEPPKALARIHYSGIARVRRGRSSAAGLGLGRPGISLVVAKTCVQPWHDRALSMATICRICICVWRCCLLARIITPAGADHACRRSALDTACTDSAALVELLLYPRAAEVGGGAGAEEGSSSATPSSARPSRLATGTREGAVEQLRWREGTGTIARLYSQLTAQLLRSSTG
jgi:hypothetical protein